MIITITMRFYCELSGMVPVSSNKLRKVVIIFKLTKFSRNKHSCDISRKCMTSKKVFCLSKTDNSSASTEFILFLKSFQLDSHVLFTEFTSYAYYVSCIKIKITYFRWVLTHRKWKLVLNNITTLKPKIYLWL